MYVIVIYSHIVKSIKLQAKKCDLYFLTSTMPFHFSLIDLARYTSLKRRCCLAGAAISELGGGIPWACEPDFWGGGVSQMELISMEPVLWGLGKLKTGVTCLCEKELPLPRWRSLADMMFTGTIAAGSPPETNRKQERTSSFFFQPIRLLLAPLIVKS